MENKEEIKCSYHNCDKTYTKEYLCYLSSGLKSPPIKDEDKFHQILQGLLTTCLFCMNCSTNHAATICMNSNIPIGK